MPHLLFEREGARDVCGLAATPAKHGSMCSQALGPLAALGGPGTTSLQAAQPLCQGRRPLRRAHPRWAGKPLLWCSPHRRGASSAVPERRPRTALVGEGRKEPPCPLLPLHQTFVLRCGCCCSKRAFGWRTPSQGALHLDGSGSNPSAVP